jgi:hypothetical protein
VILCGWEFCYHKACSTLFRLPLGYQELCEYSHDDYSLLETWDSCMEKIRESRDTRGCRSSFPPVLLLISFWSFLLLLVSWCFSVFRLLESIPSGHTFQQWRFGKWVSWCKKVMCWIILPNSMLSPRGLDFWSEVFRAPIFHGKYFLRVWSPEFLTAPVALCLGVPTCPRPFNWIREVVLRMHIFSPWHAHLCWR